MGLLGLGLYLAGFSFVTYGVARVIKKKIRK